MEQTSAAHQGNGSGRNDTHRQENVAPYDEGEGDNESPVPSGDLPFVRDGFGGEDNHHNDAGEADDEGELEAFPDTGHYSDGVRKCVTCHI
jgi:hypothetical protein